MTTDIYTITGRDSAEAALWGLHKTARFEGVDEGCTAHIRSLATAMLGVAQGLDRVRNIQLWMEIKQGEAILRLAVDCVVDMSEEDELLELSTSGKNTERKGLWAKIKGAFEEVAIADNEELNTFGFIPPVDDMMGSYPVYNSFVLPPRQQTWNGDAAEKLETMADWVDVAYSSDKVEIAAHVRYVK